MRSDAGCGNMLSMLGDTAAPHIDMTQLPPEVSADAPG
jgi:hypothetical protein